MEVKINRIIYLLFCVISHCLSNAALICHFLVSVMICFPKCHRKMIVVCA